MWAAFKCAKGGEAGGFKTGGLGWDLPLSLGFPEFPSPTPGMGFLQGPLEGPPVAPSQPRSKCSSYGRS